MIETTMGLWSIESVVGNDFRALVDLVKLAEDKGVDYVTGHDHVAVGNFNKDEYPEKKIGFPGALDAAWPEPITLLAGIAGATGRIRVTTNVLIGPLRPAVLLAKQLSTLDVVSRGRTEIGLGAGWQRAEFDACGIPFETRFAYLEEQIKVCRLVWTARGPASFEGKHINFKQIFVRPAPMQAGGVPIWLGLAATDLGCARIADLADGWFANTLEISVYAASIKRIREAFVACGKDPATLKVQAEIEPIMLSDGKADFDAMFATVPAMIKAGVTRVAVMPGRYCHSPEDAAALLDRLVAINR